MTRYTSPSPTGRVLCDRPGAVALCVGYIDYSPTPAEPDPRQVGLFG